MAHSARIKDTQAHVSSGPASFDDFDDEFDELADLYAEAARRRPSFIAAHEDTKLRQALLSQLLEIRKHLKISQKIVAERMQTTQSAVSDLENGVVDPHLSTLQRYARAVTARINLTVDLPHDSPWCDAWFYERTPNRTRINSNRPPTPPVSYAREWRSRADDCKTSYSLIR
jgi:transcriptional regulator with XRE-family HTH domain